MFPDSADKWKIQVDTGGTFTDCIAWDSLGNVHRAKVLSSSALRGEVSERCDGARLRVVLPHPVPDRFFVASELRVLGSGLAGVRVLDSSDDGCVTLERPVVVKQGDSVEFRFAEEPPVLAARLVTRTPADKPLPPMALRLATTRGTNALLERKGTRVAFFVTSGFGDLLHIGDQTRSDLFALDIRKPTPLCEAVVEVDERLSADGGVLRPIELEQVRLEAQRLVQAGIRSAAVALLHAYRNPLHEQQVADVLRESGFTHVSVSSELAPLIRILPRAQTAEADAYLGPIIHEYLRKIAEAAAPESMHVMTSAGALMRPGQYHAKDSLLSGPAGGVVGASAAGVSAGYHRLLTFDMGGTSTDVSRYDDGVARVYEHRVGDARLLAPAVEIETVAAGGGSICRFDGERLTVGPESAGADPGPACYGAGGPLTVTDVNLLLGRLDPERFGIPVDVVAAHERFEELLTSVRRRDPDASAESILLGLIDIADEHMADAIRAVSLRRGYDPADYALVAFGGAGGQHGCGVAERLGIGTVIIPPDTGLLSAVGLGRASIERISQAQVLALLADICDELPRRFDELETQARREVEQEGIPAERIALARRLAFLRLAGQEAAIEIEWTPDSDPAAEFRDRYETIYGHFPEGRAIEVESLRVAAQARVDHRRHTTMLAEQPGEALPPRVSTWASGEHKTPVHQRSRLSPQEQIGGPALVNEAHSVTAVAPGWHLSVHESGALILKQQAAAVVSGQSASSRPEAVELELFTARFRAIAGEMGEQLQRTSISTSVKERRDFSCALLDADGYIIVNAPHIPVHLGAIGLCVREVAARTAVKPGDVLVTNHPAYGGSHLPDVTVITPVFLSDSDRVFAWLANRAHHAEIGGTRPGSMPPDARSLAEEGVTLPPAYIFDGGTSRWNEIRARFEQGPFPSRNVEENLADLQAAVSANRLGERLLSALVVEHGADVVTRYMGRLRAYAAGRMRAAIGRLPDGRYHAVEKLDDGSPIEVAVHIDGERAHVDFTGSAPVHRGNLNATRAIVQSAVIYAFRTLVKEPLPLNEGLLDPVTMTLPPGMLNPSYGEAPESAPAVVGGNTETSQRVVDTVFKALGIVACSQGTMNNLLFGNDRFGYYETICGGAGAGDGFDGADAVHTHMTNTRLTDPELLEFRYPVRLERFAVRKNSGGSGRWKGGDGIVRELTFLAPVSLSILSQHRVEQPYGLQGGEPGRRGRQVVVRADGCEEELGSIVACEMEVGDRLILKTPGGGGYGTRTA